MDQSYLMCGILGYISRHISHKVDQNRFAKALETIHHRGPDDIGIWIDSEKKRILGHVRLSILDLSSLGHQPMTDDEEGIIIVFNGEIYNFKELRRDLEKKGCHFKSNSDTEVLISLYKVYGTSFLPLLNGMFAIAIYDVRNDELFLARDRFGKKPLYFFKDEKSFLFSSEIKAILSLLDHKPEMNGQALLQYLSFLSCQPPHTFFNGIFKLEAGSSLRYKDGSLFKECYYDPLSHIDPDIIQWDEAKVLFEIEQQLLQSIQSRLVSDVDVASFLSGGIDSSLITAIYSKFSDKPLNTFSAGFDEYERYDETRYAEKVAKQCHANFYPLIITKKDFLGCIDDVVYQLDEPINDPATVPTYLLSEFVRKHGIKVALTGEGSDEQFLGYDAYFDIFRYLELLPKGYHVPEHNPVTLYLSEHCNLTKEWERLRRLFNNEIVYRTIGENFTDGQKRELLKRSVFVSKTHSLDTIQPIFDHFSQYNLDHTQWASYIDLKIWIAEVLMMKLDKMSMAHGLELRAPFLDFHLVNLIFSINPDIRRNHTSKYLLKNIAEKFLPKEIIHRKKKGFSSPFIEWMYDEYGDEILNGLLSMNKKIPIFNETFIRFLFEEGKMGRFKLHLWGLWVLSRWVNIHY